MADPPRSSPSPRPCTGARASTRAACAAPGAVDAHHRRARRPVRRSRAALLIWLEPLALPVALACLAHAWVIPELYAAARARTSCGPRRRADRRAESARARAARRPRRPRRARPARPHRARRSSAGASATWLVGEAGALLVRSGGRRGGLLVHRRPRTGDAALRRPHRPPPARAAHRRAGLRHGGQPGVLRGALACAAPAHAVRCARRSTSPADAVGRTVQARPRDLCHPGHDLRVGRDRHTSVP